MSDQIERFDRPACDHPMRENQTHGGWVDYQDHQVTLQEAQQERDDALAGKAATISLLKEVEQERQVAREAREEAEIWARIGKGGGCVHGRTRDDCASCLQTRLHHRLRDAEAALAQERERVLEEAKPLALEPDPEPEKCPTCGSDDPNTWRKFQPHGCQTHVQLSIHSNAPFCPDSFHPQRSKAHQAELDRREGLPPDPEEGRER